MKWCNGSDEFGAYPNWHRHSNKAQTNPFQSCLEFLMVFHEMRPTVAYFWPPCLSVKVAQDLQRTLWQSVLHLQSFSSLNLYSDRHGPDIGEFHDRCIIKKKRHECILFGKMNEWDILGYCNEFCFVESRVCRAWSPKGPPCLSHLRALSVLLVLSTLKFCMWLKHPLSKGTCPEFEVLEDSVTVWGTVPLCGKQFQCLTAGVIWSLPLLSIVSSSFQLWNERSCMYLELEMCSHVAVGLMLLFSFAGLNRKKHGSQSKYTTSVGQDQGKAGSLFC